MFTWISRIIWLLLSAFLLIRVVESLTSPDQTTSVLPIPNITGSVDVPFLLAGVAWGTLLTFGSISASARPRIRGAGAGPRELAPATVIELGRTGVTINDVPQYEICLEVQPVAGEPFVSSVTELLTAPEAADLRPGRLLAVEYRPDAPDRLALSDPGSPEVERMMLRWRIAHGLIADDVIAARTTGVSQPASVLALRPTGDQKEGQVEITARLLVSPADGSPPFEADSTVFVHPAALANVQVGSPVFAMYEPAHPDRVHMTIQRQGGLA